MYAVIAAICVRGAAAYGKNMKIGAEETSLRNGALSLKSMTTIVLGARASESRRKASGIGGGMMVARNGVAPLR